MGDMAGAGLGGVLGLVIIILIVLWLAGALGTGSGADPLSELLLCSARVRRP